MHALLVLSYLFFFSWFDSVQFCSIQYDSCPFGNKYRSRDIKQKCSASRCLFFAHSPFFLLFNFSISHSFRILNFLSFSRIFFLSTTFFPFYQRHFVQSFWSTVCVFMYFVSTVTIRNPVKWNTNCTIGFYIWIP